MERPQRGRINKIKTVESVFRNAKWGLQPARHFLHSLWGSGKIPSSHVTGAREATHGKGNTLDGVCTRCCAALFVPFATIAVWRAGRGYMKLEKNFLSPKPNFPIFRWAPGGPGSGGCKVTHTPPTPNPIGAEPMSVVLCTRSLSPPFPLFGFW